MTKPKSVASTLKGILDTPIMKLIQDKGSLYDMDRAVESVEKYWNFDLYSRKPGPAYDGSTDLDLAAFLYALVERGAVINFPTYESTRVKRVKEGQMLTSKENRHGPIVGLVPNKETFRFSVRVKDMNVMTTEDVGDFRTFSLTDFDGSWSDSWKTIQFLPDAKENDFINESRIASGNRINFNNFISPNRWTAFFGQYYFITKAMESRLYEDATHFKNVVKEILDAGIDFPEDRGPKTWPHQKTVGGTKSIKVTAFQVELDLPDYTGEYPEIAKTQENLVKYSQLRNHYIYTLIPKLRFMTRATEYAFWKNGQDRMPAWLTNVKWEKDYVQKGKRKKWDRLVLFQPAPGETGVSIRKREWEKSERVSA